MFFDKAAKIKDLFVSCKWSLAVAESCTGGMLGAALTSVPGSSAYFYGGFIVYSNAAKINFLGVQPETLETWGAVSEATAREMAENTRKLSQANVAVAITGIAGPEGGSPAKPVGLVFIAAAGEKGTRVKKMLFTGSREEIRQAAVMAALDIILETAERR